MQLQRANRTIRDLHGDRRHGDGGHSVGFSPVLRKRRVHAVGVLAGGANTLFKSFSKKDECDFA